MIHSHIYYSSVKRSILIIALLCAVLMQATAQNRYKNEIAFTYAPLSNYDLQGQILLQIDKTISDKIDVQIPGSFGIEYFRRLGDLVSVGGIGSIYYFASQPEGMHKFSYINYALMAGVKLHWYEREWFGAYSKFAFGANYVSSDTSQHLHFSFQSSLLGVEVGKRLRGFVELGIGYQGIAFVGIRYRF